MVMPRPSKLPRWADVGGVIVEPTEARKDIGWQGGKKPPAPYENWLFNLLYQWVGFFDGIAGAGFFGDGSDGDASLDGSVAAPTWVTKSGAIYTLTRDVFANNLTLTSTAQIYTAGFRLFVFDTLNVGASAKIQCNGFPGVGITGGNASSATGSLQNGSAGGAGGTSGTPTGTAGGAKTIAIGGTGGTGGAGDSTGSSVVGSSGGARTAPTAAMGGFRSLRSTITGYIEGLVGGVATLNALAGGTGGGGGHYGNDGVSSTATGGGGGGGAGTSVIAARNLVLDGSLECKGGNGGDAVYTAGSAAQAGGGGGGGGGGLQLTYGERSGSGTVSVVGGAGGAGLGGGLPAATAGASGTLVEIDLSLGGALADGPHEESGVGAMTNIGAGNGVDYLDVVFEQAFLDTAYKFEFAAYSAGGLFVTLMLTQKTTTGMRVTPVTPFVGEISWSVTV